MNCRDLFLRLDMIYIVIVCSLIRQVYPEIPPSPVSDSEQLIEPRMLLQSNSSYRIWNGMDAPKGRYPYMVSICDNKGVHLCGGTLISSQWVLTAAHCLHSMLEATDDSEEKQDFNPILYVGLYSRAEEDYEVHSIRNHIIYPDFDIRNADGDIALLQLSQQSRVPWVQLAVNEDNLYVGADMMVMGWGRTEDGSRADVLQHVKMDFVAEEECNSLWNGAVLDSMFCAGGGAFDACDGDSGGPIVLRGKDNEEDIQIGIVSWGRSMSCGVEGRPGVYTNIGYAPIRDWINSTITPDTSQLQPVLQAMTDPSAMQQMNGLRTVAIGDPLPAQRTKQCVQTELGEQCTDPPGFDVMNVEGFTVLPSKDLGDLYNYQCANSLWKDGCLLDGSADLLGAICQQDIQCHGFVHLPHGYGSRDIPTGFLKTGPIDENAMISSNWTAVYLKEAAMQLPQDTGVVSLGQSQQDAPVRTYLHIQQRDLPDSYNYWCSGTEAMDGSQKCQLSGTLTFCAERCDVDPKCNALVFLPAESVRQIPDETVQVAYRNLSSKNDINSLIQGTCTLKQGPVDLRHIQYNPAKELFLAI
eukprot:TRINITY_DN5431_c0_g2_i1.p1 TRINITY_DN5431_c0_g2~~TRINITY_DN5431_c0_g2_i1.p1  ORF type:complete len:582 (+),score=55.95 TRINITY_DN5431_c0_g2_i1:64-1809(+)